MGCGTSIAIENQTRPSETGKYWFFIPNALMWFAILFNLFSLSSLQQPWFQEVCISYLLKNMAMLALHLVPSAVFFFHPQGII